MHTVGTQEAVADVSPREHDADGAKLVKDDLFHVLQNQRRRRVLKYLSDKDGQVDMRDIAEQVTAWENEKEVAQITSTERQRVYIGLYQSHLPKLDEMGIINYNQSRGIVERTPLADQFNPYLHVNERATDSDEEIENIESISVRLRDADPTMYYSVAMFTSVVLTASAWGGLVPITLSAYVGVFVVAMFGAVTAGVYLRKMLL